ncbi:MAG: DMT family transporter [Desulfohalobiaceae bacterium]|nr:DMT family transporter [Desulfohalobiaceae bacterium]
MLAIALSLAACLGWGVSDFLGGLKSRQLPSLTVLIVANIFGTVLIGAIVLLRWVPPPLHPDLLWAVGGGLSGLLAMLMLYRGFAVGSMSIIAPLSASGIILPVIWGLFQGEALDFLKYLGIAAAILGIICAAREKDPFSHKKQLTRGLHLALGAALGFGLFFILMDRACEIDPYWAALIMRISYGVFPLFMIPWARPSFRVDSSDLPGIAFIGIADALAGFSFALATTIGLLSVVSVVGSLYPAVTVILSTTLLHERQQAVQYLGVGLALTGVVLLSL